MRIGVVTGSRADWGLLLPVVRQIDTHPALQLVLWVTGSHLEPHFGHTVREVRSAGLPVDAEVPLQLQTGTAADTGRALANAIAGFAELLQANPIDLLLVLGDRFEIFGAVQAAALAGVPIAHIAGGDISEGAYDDGMRHAISKLSQLHFPTNADAAQRLRQMGEPAERIILAGSPGIDAILATPRLTRAQLEAQLGIAFAPRNIAVSFHPATLDQAAPSRQAEQLVEGLSRLDARLGIICSGSNADTGGERVNQVLQDFAARRPLCWFIQSLGAQNYYSLLAEVDLLVGNSSSGLYEAPSLHTPTLDVGIRQQGRLRGPSVSHCANEAGAIHTGTEQLLAKPPTDFSSPYGDGRAARRIVEALAAVDDPRALLIKHFHRVD